MKCPLVEMAVYASVSSLYFRLGSSDNLTYYRQSAHMLCLFVVLHLKIPVVMDSLNLFCGLLVEIFCKALKESETNYQRPATTSISIPE